MLQKLASQLDLTNALKQADSNDLLPPRQDDKVGGELGKRFVEHLHKQIEDDRYEPDRAEIVQVPKPGFTSRPAALLTLNDRVVYESIVALFRPRLSKYLMSNDVVFWPRETYENKRWKEFERAPLEKREKYVVYADVSGFYESIDHIQLEDDLVLATGMRGVSYELRQFLSRVMTGRRGLPQGLLPSDTLATTYLQPVDAAMLRHCFNYWRHGDDIRVACENMSRAREAISRLEDELRRRGLLLNSSKVAIVTGAQYEQSLQSGEESYRKLRARLLNQNISRVSSDDKELIAAMESAQLDEQWGWNLFYHKNISVEDVIDQLRGHLAPNDVEVAGQAFSEAFQRAPGRFNALPKDQFHFLVTSSLVKLAAARSPVALKQAASIMARFPEKTELVCQYLQALVKSHPSDVIGAVENVVNSLVFTTPWQQAWLFRVLEAGALHVSPKVIKRLLEIATSISAHWLARVEAMKVLARSSQIERDLVTQSWNLAPRPYRCDLIAVAAMVSDTEEWARKFLQASRLDPVEQVIAKHLQLSSAQRDGRV